MNLDALVPSRSEQGPHQRVAVHQPCAAAVDPQIAGVAQQQRQDMQERLELAACVQKMAQFSPGRNAHAPQCGLVQRGLQQVHAWPQKSGIKGGCANRATAHSGIGGVAMKVRNGIAVNELQCRVAAKKIHHARPLAQKSAHACFVKLRAQLASQIRQGFFNAFDQPCFHRQRVTGNPHPAARPCGGAAQLGVFLDHDDFEAQLRRRHSRRQGARTRANHQQIAGDVSRIAGVGGAGVRL